MANYKINPKYQFKPGQTGNPKGRPKLPKAIKEARAMNRHVLAELLSKYTHYSLKELEAVAKNPHTPSFDLIVISAIKFAIQKGDAKSRDFLIERMIGRVKYEVDMVGQLGIEGQIQHKHEVTIHDKIVNLIEEIESQNE